MTNVAISTTPQGINFMLGAFQATLERKRGSLLATYFKNSKEVLNSRSPNHPALPRDKGAAESMVGMVIEALDKGNDPLSVVTSAAPKPKKSPRSVRRPQAQTPSAIRIIETLFQIRTPLWTLLVPAGKVNPHIKNRVIIQDGSGDTICEIPYNKYLELLKLG